MRRQALSVLARLAASITLPFAAAGAQQAGAPAGVVVSVRDSAGLPVEGVRISVFGRTGHGETDEGGRYRIRGLSAGRADLELQRLGFQRRTLTFVLSPGEVSDTTIVLARAVQTVEPAIVSRPGDRARRFAEFERRRVGAFGHFITRRDIERRYAVHFTDLLRLAPGVRIVTTAGRTGVRLRGATCPPHVWVDGTPSSAIEFDLDAVPLQTVEGVEIYSGPASVPAELMAGRARGRCGVIVVWTR